MSQFERNDKVQACNETDKQELVDIRNIKLDISQNIDERINSLLTQCNNPYAFRLGDYIIKFSFLDTDNTLDDLLLNHIKRKKQL